MLGGLKEMETTALRFQLQLREVIKRTNVDKLDLIFKMTATLGINLALFIGFRFFFTLDHASF